MNVERLKTFIQLAKDEGVKSLKWESEKEKMSVEFATSQEIGTSLPVHARPIHGITKEISGSSEKYHEIKSPFVRTYYASPSPGKPVFVKKGDRVQVGSVLCILEAMKIMNEIESDVTGEVVEICVENESLIEF